MLNRKIVWASVVLTELSLITSLWAEQPSGFFGRKPRTQSQQQQQRLVPIPAEAKNKPAEPAKPAEPTKQADHTVPDRGSDKVIPASKTTVQAAAVAAMNVVSTLPKVTIETMSPSEINVGKVAPFMITVNNAGETLAQGVVLRTTLPTTAELRGAEPVGEIVDKEVQFAIGDLPPRAEKLIRLEFVPRKPGAINLASTVSFSVSSQSSVLVRQPELTLVCSTPEEAMHGQSVTMKVKVTNSGDGPAEQITINQVRQPGVENASLSQLPIKIDGLAAGQSQEFELELPATSTGNIHATLVATGADDLEAKASADVRVRRPMLEIAAEGPSLRYSQRIGSYTVKVSNPGDAPASNISVVVQLPQGMQVTAIDRRATFNKEHGTLSWLLPTVEAGTTTTLQYRMKGLVDGDQQQKIVASGDFNLKAEAVQTTRIESIADLAVSVTDTPGPIEVGGTVEYTIEIKNRGTKSADKVRISAALPAGLKPVVDEENAEYTIKGNNVEFSAIGELPAGADKILRFRATGNEDGDHMVRVTLKTESLSREIVTEESTLFYAGDADLTK